MCKDIKFHEKGLDTTNMRICEIKPKSSFYKYIQFVLLSSCSSSKHFLKKWCFSKKQRKTQAVNVMKNAAVVSENSAGFIGYGEVDILAAAENYSEFVSASALTKEVFLRKLMCISISWRMLVRWKKDFFISCMCCFLFLAFLYSHKKIRIQAVRV